MNRFILLIISVLGCLSTFAQGKYEISLKAGVPIPSTLYGIFFEDINFSADGGLYGELIKNRSFEFPGNPLQGWKVFGNVELRNDGPFERNPHYVRLENPGHNVMWTGIENEGFFGIGVHGEEEYKITFWARTHNGDSSALTLQILNPSANNDQSLAIKNVNIVAKEWTKFEFTLKPNETFDRASFRIFLLNRNVSVDLEHISLFPINTWKGRENGMRKDLAQALYDLHPGIFRFPGGCIVEGSNIDTRYNWKNSIGPVENRPLNLNRWQYSMTRRFFPDYYQSYGLGFYEYFLLSEDIGAEPLPVLNCGLACQYQNHDIKAHVPVDSLDEFIQDALDLIEFANGDETTKWGVVRSKLGHSKPFNLKYIAIGNEQWDSIYPIHLEPFIKAIKAKYPKINIIGSAGPYPSGDRFDYLWKEMNRLEVDLVDEHFYCDPKWFLSQGSRYDNYNRKGPKVFAGEYACFDKGYKSNAMNDFRSALMEAAFMTNIERNADVVEMATYAPLFAHKDGWQWKPNLIWFDNLRVMKTCSWYVQQLYSQYKGSNVLSITKDGKNISGTDGLFASAVIDGNEVYVKIINTTETAREIEFNFSGLKKNQSLSLKRCIKFRADSPEDENTLENPSHIVPVEEVLHWNGKSIKIESSCFKIFNFTLGSMH